MYGMNDFEIMDLSEEDVDAASDAQIAPGHEDESEEQYVSRPRRDAAPKKKKKKSQASSAAEGKKRKSEEPPEELEEDDPEDPGFIRTDTGEQLPLIDGVPTERRRKPRVKPDPEYDLRYPDYTLTLTKGLTNSVVKRVYLAHKKGQVLLLSGFLLGVLTLCFIIFAVIYMVFSERTKQTQAAEIGTLTQQNAALNADIVSLRTRVSQLSASVNRNLENQRAADDAYEQSLLPNGFPLSHYTEYALIHEGDALPGAEDTEQADTSAEGETTEDEAEEGAETDGDAAGEETGADDLPAPIALFETTQGISVIATGGGVITRITTDPVYGTCLIIDHRNGFSSIYRTDEESLLQVSDHVTRGDVLFTITKEQAVFGYQIRFNDTYIDPSEMVQVGG